MKKTTLLFLLATLPFVGFAQTFNFTNTDDGWTELGAVTSANGDTFMTLTTVDGDGTKKNLSVGTMAAAVNTTAVSYVGITIRNNDASGPSYLRVSYPKIGGDPTKRLYKNVDITTGDTEFKTYWIDITNGTNWVGTMNDIKLHFKATGNTDYIVPNNPNNISIDIDKIEFASSVPTTEKHTYNFDTSDEGWNDLTRCDVAAVGGNLEVTLTGADKNSKVGLTGFHINTTTNKFAHIVLKNNTNDDQLKLVYTSTVGSKTIPLVITTMDAAYKTYDFDLGSAPEWTGNISDIKLAFDDVTTQEGNGVILVDKIVFDNKVTLRVKRNELTNFSLYPNPVQGKLNFTSQTDISKIEVYNLTGQRLLQLKSFPNNSLDVSSLRSGMYFVNVEDIESRSTTKKIIVSK